MKYITLCNKGYYELCKNMLISAEKCGINSKDFYIACLDNYSLNLLKNYGNAFLYLEHPLEEFQNWSLKPDSGFRKIIVHKWKIISQLYTEYKYICWVDSDVVFLKKPPIENNKKVLFQIDYPNDQICSGFMVFNDSEISKNIISKCSRVEGDDQEIVNTIVNFEDIEFLDIEKYPNGYYYFELGNKKNPYIVHNNWIIGKNEKINRFKYNNLWFTKESINYERF